MKPTKKQPAVTREEIKAALSGSNVGKVIAETGFIALRLLVERDDALKEINWLEVLVKDWQQLAKGAQDAAQRSNDLSEELQQARCLYTPDRSFRDLTDHIFQTREEKPYEQALTERDEAIREVEILKASARAREQMLRDIGDNLAKADAGLEAEKRRTAAFEEVAVDIETEWRSRNAWVGEKRPEHIRAWVQREAQKILAPSDSGGEKKA